MLAKLHRDEGKGKNITIFDVIYTLSKRHRHQSNMFLITDMSTAVLDRRLNRCEISLFNFVNYQHPRYSL